MALEEDLSWVPSTHTGWLTAAPIPGHPMTFGLQGHLHTHGTHNLMQASTGTHKYSALNLHVNENISHSSLVQYHEKYQAGT